MDKSNISKGIPPEVLTLIETNIKACRDAINPYIIPLTAEERRKVYKAADGSEAFLEKGISYATRFPQFVPSQLTVADWNIVFGVMSSLVPCVQMATDFLTVLCDTKMYASVESMKSTLSYYSSVQRAAKENIASAKDIYTDMKKRYERKKKTEPKDTPTAKKEIVVVNEDETKQIS